MNLYTPSGDGDLEKTDSLCESTLKIVLNEKLVQRHCTTANLNLRVLLDEGQFCFEYIGMPPGFRKLHNSPCSDVAKWNAGFTKFTSLSYSKCITQIKKKSVKVINIKYSDISYFQVYQLYFL